MVVVAVGADPEEDEGRCHHTGGHQQHGLAGQEPRISDQCIMIVMVRGGSYLTSTSSSSVPSMARVAATVVASCGLSREEECEMKTRTV